MKKTGFNKVMLLGMIVFLVMSSNVCSHEKIVTGKVFPAGMSVPMRDVTVEIIGNDSVKALTDGNGFFKIRVSSFPVQLSFTKSLYETRVVTVKKPSDIVVYLSVEK